MHQARIHGDVLVCSLFNVTVTLTKCIHNNLVMQGEGGWRYLHQSLLHQGYYGAPWSEMVKMLTAISGMKQLRHFFLLILSSYALLKLKWKL